MKTEQLLSPKNRIILLTIQKSTFLNWEIDMVSPIYFSAKGRLAGMGDVVSENAPLRNPSSQKTGPFES
jgi:hypothetical protein